MDQLKELLDLFSDNRMKYGHLTIIFLYGLIAVFAIGPFLGLVFFPPTEPIDVAQIGPYYWERLVNVNITGLLLYAVVAFNAGLLVSSLQQLTKERYWKWVIWPLATMFGRGKDCLTIEERLVTSRNMDKGEYREFLDWLEPQKDRRRVRGWDWFISNAYRTLSFILLIFWGLNLFVILLALVLPHITSLVIPLATVTIRSWSVVIVVALLFLFLIPGDIHHYLVRAEGDNRLLKEFRQTKQNAADQDD